VKGIVLCLVCVLYGGCKEVRGNVLWLVRNLYGRLQARDTVLCFVLFGRSEIKDALFCLVCMLYGRLEVRDTVLC
jgi:hypothetical protein